MINSQDRAPRPSLPVCACLLAAAMLSACGGGSGSEAQPTSEASAAPSTPVASTAQAPADTTAAAVEVVQAPAAEQPVQVVQAVTTAPATEPAPTDTETATTLATSSTATPDSTLPRTVGGGSGGLSTTLRWAAPKTLANGTFTTSVAGFRVYYGTAPGNYIGTAFFPGGNASSGTVSGLGHGTWYFVVATVDAAGSESSASYQLSKTL